MIIIIEVLIALFFGLFIALGEEHIFLKSIFLFMTMIFGMVGLNFAASTLTDATSIRILNICFYLLIWVTTLSFVYMIVYFIKTGIEHKNLGTEEEEE